MISLKKYIEEKGTGGIWEVVIAIVLLLIAMAAYMAYSATVQEKGAENIFFLEKQIRDKTITWNNFKMIGKMIRGVI